MPTVPVLVSPAWGFVAIVASLGSDDGARVTAMEYVLVVTPSWAFDIIVMVGVLPSAPKARLPDAAPDATVVPFTVITAFGSIAVGVTVSDAVV